MFGLYEVGLVGEVGDVWFVRGRFGWGGWRCLVYTR